MALLLAKYLFSLGTGETLKNPLSLS